MDLLLFMKGHPSPCLNGDVAVRRADPNRSLILLSITDLTLVYFCARNIECFLDLGHLYLYL